MNVRESAKRPRGRPPEGDKRRQILDAALELFAERGFHGTAVPLVAEAAGVGTGTIYHYFENKEVLVNAVFRDAKARLRGALIDGLVFERAPRELFLEIWDRLVGFARAEPVSFQFLEMQDHVPYLDEPSRALEREVLAPLWLAGQELARRQGRKGLPPETMMALVWGALVGVIKAERLGYLTLTPALLRESGEAAWAMVDRGVSNPKTKSRERARHEPKE